MTIDSRQEKVRQYARNVNGHLIEDSSHHPEIYAKLQIAWQKAREFYPDITTEDMPFIHMDRNMGMGGLISAHAVEKDRVRFTEAAEKLSEEQFFALICHELGEIILGTHQMGSQEAKTAYMDSNSDVSIRHLKSTEFENEIVRAITSSRGFDINTHAEKELMADQIAIRLGANPRALGEVLMEGRQKYEAAKKNTGCGTILAPVFELFVKNVLKWDVDAMREIGEVEAQRLQGIYPPLDQRLQALGFSEAETQQFSHTHTQQ